MISSKLAGNCFLKEWFSDGIIDTANIPAI